MSPQGPPVYRFHSIPLTTPAIGPADPFPSPRHYRYLRLSRSSPRLPPPAHPQLFSRPHCPHPAASAPLKNFKIGSLFRMNNATSRDLRCSTGHGSSMWIPCVARLWSTRVAVARFRSALTEIAAPIDIRIAHRGNEILELANEGVVPRVEVKRAT